MEEPIFNLGFLVLRINPLTLDHLKILDYASSKCDKLIVFIGSSHAPLSEKTPFPCHVRKQMLVEALGDEKLEQVEISYLEDYHDNEAWSRAVKGRVNRFKNKIYNEIGRQVIVTMYGGKKEGDTSTFYYKLFPETFCQQDIIHASEGAVSATDIREALFEGSPVVKVPTSTRKGPWWVRNIPFQSIFFKFFDSKEAYTYKEYKISDLVHETTLAIINKFCRTKEWENVVIGRNAHRGYSLRVQYPVLDFIRYLEENGENVTDLKLKARDYYLKNRPYAVQGQSVDGLIRQNNMYLLIKRKSYPYKGGWAIPGGIVDPHETRFFSVLRELKEEVGIRMNKHDLSECLIGELEVDNPNRDPRLRMFTKVFIFEIPDNKENLLKAGDDAEDFIWRSYEEIIDMKEEIAFDHLAIIREAEKIRVKKPLLEY